MKKTIIILLVSISIIGITGCKKSNNEESDSKMFSINCEKTKRKEDGITETNKIVYYFGKDQYATLSENSIIKVYDDPEVYQIDKENSEEIASDDSSIEVEIQANDATTTITTLYKTKITKEEIANSEDKNYYKAINVLRRSETNYTCSVNGIDKNKIK